jgi:hypothetical protein
MPQLLPLSFSKEKIPTTHWMGDCVDSSAGLNIKVKVKFSPLQALEALRVVRG